MKQYKYHTKTFMANIIETIDWINTHHPEWDIISIETVRNTTIVIHRTPIE